MENAFLTREQVRELDLLATREFGIPGLVLMENAGRGCADVLERQGIRGPVVIACGKGNNGGDGFVLARHLDLRGYAVRLVLVGDLAAGPPDASANWRVVRKMGLPFVQLSEEAPRWSELDDVLEQADWIVDALLGIGARGNPRPPLDQLIGRLNAQAARKFAIDVPSGLDANSGQPGEPTFRADHTCTFVARKLGFAHPGAAAWLGETHVADIGAPRVLTSRFGLP